MFHHFGSHKLWCERYKCYEYATKRVGNHYLCSRHADEFIFTGAAEKDGYVKVADIEEKE